MSTLNNNGGADSDSDIEISTPSRGELISIALADDNATLLRELHSKREFTYFERGQLIDQAFACSCDDVYSFLVSIGTRPSVGAHVCILLRSRMKNAALAVLHRARDSSYEEFCVTISQGQRRDSECLMKCVELQYVDVFRLILASQYERRAAAATSQPSKLPSAMAVHFESTLSRTLDTPEWKSFVDAAVEVGRAQSVVDLDIPCTGWSVKINGVDCFSISNLVESAILRGRLDMLKYLIGKHRLPVKHIPDDTIKILSMTWRAHNLQRSDDDEKHARRMREYIDHAKRPLLCIFPSANANLLPSTRNPSKAKNGRAPILQSFFEYPRFDVNVYTIIERYM
jgi:hypothetical protein